MLGLARTQDRLGAPGGPWHGPRAVDATPKGRAAAQFKRRVFCGVVVRRCAALILQGRACSVGSGPAGGVPGAPSPAGSIPRVEVRSSLLGRRSGGGARSAPRGPESPRGRRGPCRAPAWPLPYTPCAGAAHSAPMRGESDTPQNTARCRGNQGVSGPGPRRQGRPSGGHAAPRRPRRGGAGAPPPQAHRSLSGGGGGGGAVGAQALRPSRRHRCSRSARRAAAWMCPGAASWRPPALRTSPRATRRACG